MASCFCIHKLEDLLRSLIPVASLNVAVPPVVPKLAAISQTLSASSAASASMSATASFAASLPAIPIHASVAAKLAANLTAAQQINAAFGVNMASPTSTMQLRATIQSLATHLNLAMTAVPIPPHQLIAALNLTSTLASIAQFRASYSVDLLAHTASVQLRAALQARVTAQPAGTPPAAAAVSASAAAKLAAYAQLAAAAQAVGGVANLVPALTLMASLQVPQPSMRIISQLAAITTLQQTRVHIQSVLGLNPLAANLGVTIRQALQPLSFLESLTLNVGAPLAAASSTPVLSESLSAQMSMLARMDLRAIAGLKIPNLAPLHMVAQFAATSPMTSTSSCGSGCPVFRA